MERLENQQEESIKICYDTGKMVIYLRQFFPCTLQVARKIFPWILQYCKEAEKDRLDRYLKEYVSCIEEEVLALEKRMEKLPLHVREYRKLNRELCHVKTCRKRALRNLDFLQEQKDR